MKSENEKFWRTLIFWVVMVMISSLAWLGIRHFQTNITPIAKPIPKTVAHE